MAAAVASVPAGVAAARGPRLRWRAGVLRHRWPENGDRIMKILPWVWQSFVVRGKSVEVRCRRVAPGPMLLSVSGQGTVCGACTLGPAQFVATKEDFLERRAAHCWTTQKDLPYAKTYFLPVSDLVVFETPVPYVRKFGARSFHEFESVPRMFKSRPRRVSKRFRKLCKSTRRLLALGRRGRT